LVVLGILPGSGYVYRTNKLVNSGSYWDLNGNTISGTNWMGSINFQDVRFRAGNRPSMIISSGLSAADINAGFVGINNTAPTARFHVDCIGGNAAGSGASEILKEVQVIYW
jgi:hypothetical protein